MECGQDIFCSKYPDRLQKAVRYGQWKLLMDGKHFLLFDLMI